MPFNFDLTQSMPWDRRRSSLGLNCSRRNSLLSVSLFGDVALLGVGGGGGDGGTSSTRNSLGLGTSMYGDSDPFAPLAYDNITGVPFNTRNDISFQTSQLNDGNNFGGSISAFLQNCSQRSANGTMNARHSLNFYNTSNITTNTLATPSHGVGIIDRLLGERSESSGISQPSATTASSYGSASSIAASLNQNYCNGIFSNIGNDHMNSIIGQTTANNGSANLGDGNTLLSQMKSMNHFSVALLQQRLEQEHQQHHQHQQQQQQQQYLQQEQHQLLQQEHQQQLQQRRSSLGLDLYPLNGSELDSPQKLLKDIADLKGQLHGSFSPLTPFKTLNEYDEIIKSSIHDDIAEAKCPEPIRTYSSTSDIVSTSARSSLRSNSEANLDGVDDEDDDDDDDDEMDNQARFKPFHEEKWSTRYKELLEFHKQHGHAAVPHTYPPNAQLARWVKRQRRQYKIRKDNRQSTMTPERLDLLNSVGFIWDSHEVNWREKLHNLIQFRANIGHCNVPSNYSDKKLATWVKCQRRQYKLYWDKKPSAMTTERITELEKHGFEWEIRATLPRSALAGMTNKSATGSNITTPTTAALSLDNHIDPLITTSASSLPSQSSIHHDNDDFELTMFSFKSPI